MNIASHMQPKRMGKRWNVGLVEKELEFSIFEGEFSLFLLHVELTKSEMKDSVFRKRIMLKQDGMLFMQNYERKIETIRFAAGIEVWMG